MFNLPEMIWVWWNIEFLVMFLVGSAILGLVAGKLAPEEAELLQVNQNQTVGFTFAFSRNRLAGPYWF